MANINIQSKREESHSKTVEEDNVMMISFSTEQDRVKGIGTLFKSPYGHTTLGKNKFSVGKEVINSKIFENKNIKYTIIDNL
jgi:hypothetical protein